ncbi:MAG TPA: hypothetical protein VM532_16450 [Burkholderiales bacterium]|nr:hypothetical protein [Burkholderiales bacterium]
MNDDEQSTNSSLSDVGDLVSDVRYRLIFRSLYNTKEVDTCYALKGDPIFCDTEAVDFVSLAFHPEFKKKILHHLSMDDPSLSEEEKEEFLDRALDSGDDDLEAMRNNKVPPSAAYSYDRELTDEDLKDACDLERKLLPRQKSLFAAADSEGNARTILNGKILGWIGGGVMRNKEDFNAHYVDQGRQGNSAEDIENWLAEWTDEHGSTVGFSSIGAEIPSSATNTAIKPKSDNPNEYELDESRITALLGPVEIKTSINGGPLFTETAMAIVGLGNLKPNGQILIPFEKTFFQDLNKAIADGRLFAPRNSGAGHSGEDALQRRWSGELLAYQNLCTRKRKYESDGTNDLYQQAARSFVEHAKAQRLSLNQTPEAFLSSMQSWLSTTNNQFAKAAIALNHFAQTHFDHKYRFDITRGEIKRVLNKEHLAEIDKMVGVYKEECEKAGISPGNRLNLNREVQPLYEAMLDTLESDSPYADLKAQRDNRKTTIARIWSRIPSVTPIQNAIFTRISEILTNGSIDRSNPTSMINLSDLRIDVSTAASGPKRKGADDKDDKEGRRSRRKK